MLQAKNCILNLPSGAVDYIRFCSGKKILIMIPGVGDGLKTVKGMALPFALLYRSLAENFTVYVFSRRRILSPGMTTRDMAEDLNTAIRSSDGLSVPRRMEHSCHGSDHPAEIPGKISRAEIHPDRVCARGR